MNNSRVFTKCLITASVLSLSACSSMPRVEEYDLSRVGEGILKAGHTTADLSSRAWKRTTYLLGFSDDDGQSTAADEGLLMDAEDVALLEEADISERDTLVRPIVIRQAVPSRPSDSSQPPINADGSAQFQMAVNDDVSADLLEPSSGNTDRLIAAGSTLPDTPAGDVPAQTPAVVEDLVYVVAANETLWDIAKASTGDATNWHLLADSNNLGPDAAVYPGQELLIPGHLLTPAREVDGAHTISETVTDTQQANAVPYVDTQSLTGATPASTETAAEPASVPGKPEYTEGRAFQIGPGETLWDFSKRVTGDATNWHRIAEVNHFTEQQTRLVRSGQTVHVPEELIRPEQQAGETTEQSSTIESLSAGLPRIVEEPSSSPAAANANQASEPTKNLDVQNLPNMSRIANEPTNQVDTITESFPDQSSALIASVNQADKPVDTGSEQYEPLPAAMIETSENREDNSPSLYTAQSPAEVADEMPAQVIVSGTYYPKAVYNEADFSSSLLMRVSPGTTLRVSQTIGNWYQVNTKKGLGYVHQRDTR